MNAAEGWAAQQLKLPAAWYQCMPNLNTGYPISGDHTAVISRDQELILQEPPC